MVSWIPLVSALGQRLSVIDAFRGGRQTLRGTSAVQSVHAAISTLATERMSGPEAGAVLSPGIVIASLLGSASGSLISLPSMNRAFPPLDQD